MIRSSIFSFFFADGTFWFNLEKKKDIRVFFFTFGRLNEDCFSFSFKLEANEGIFHHQSPFFFFAHFAGSALIWVSSARFSCMHINTHAFSLGCFPAFFSNLLFFLLPPFPVLITLCNLGKCQTANYTPLFFFFLLLASISSSYPQPLFY